jgi:hypothetical protein
MASKLYGVFVGPKWGMTRNKRVAIRAAREHKGEVRVMDDDPAMSAWDSPTFRIMSNGS